MIAAPSSSPPRHNRDCLWGCFAVLAFIFLPVLLAAITGGWFIYQGYRHDPVLQGVVALVRRDGMAEAVLGENIHVTGMEGSALTYLWGSGESGGSYVVDLAGSKGQGALHVTAHSRRGRLSVESMILDGPHGDHYDLLHHTAEPNGNSTQSI